MSDPQPAACIAGVIPARYGSTRFPGKMLHPIAGKPLIQHVFERASRAHRLHEVIIATDDRRILLAARAFGAPAVLTRDDHVSGTDRVAEVLANRPEFSHAVNLQGDEPLVDPGLIDDLADEMVNDPNLELITAAREIDDPAFFLDPNVVKVVFSASGNALYFSRSPIPFARDGGRAVPGHQHIGIYGYRRDVLARLVGLPPSPLERSECLEQLRALENGISIRVRLTASCSIGVDTPEDIIRVEDGLFSTGRAEHRETRRGPDLM